MIRKIYRKILYIIYIILYDRRINYTVYGINYFQTPRGLFDHQPLINSIYLGRHNIYIQVLANIGLLVNLILLNILYVLH